MESYWPEFKSVAHFWGALRLNNGYAYCPPERLFDEGFERFLSVAKELQEFGKNFIPARLRPAKPILYGVDLWELSDDIPRITIKDDAPYPLAMKEFLDKYRV